MEMLQPNNNGETNFDQQLVLVDTMNNNVEASFGQQLVLVDTMNNNVEASFGQQLVLVDAMNNNVKASSGQQLVLVDTMNNNAVGDNNYNNNENNNNNNIDGGTSFGEEDFDSANTTENQDGGSENEENPRKRKRYHRHTHHQIQQMDAFFKECPHPDDKQRKELSRLLGLDPLQIKFWFQNKRTQNKSHQERYENTQLRAANDKLRAENHHFEEALANSICPKCQGRPTALGEMSSEEHHLRIENARLHTEIAHLSVEVEKWTGKPVRNYPALSLPALPRPFEIGMGNNVYGNDGNAWRSITGPTDAAKQMVIELAAGAMDELMMMAQVGEPIWMGGANSTSLVLNLNEYSGTFQEGLRPRPNGVRSEGSRDTATVLSHHMNIVKMFMDVNHWSWMFPGMVARAMTHEVLMTGVAGDFNGSIQLMSAEFPMLSPFVSTRECYFVRYCKQHGDGLWAVVDVSIDHLIPNLELKCRRHPSGCLIQEAPTGCSKVTWIEHVEVDDVEGVHYLYQHLIRTGQAYGASRWVAALDRQCERAASIMAPIFQSVESDGLIMLTDQTKSEVLKLAERMARSFFMGVTTSSEHSWSMCSSGAGDDIRVMTSKSLSDPGRPPGNVICAATSFWAPVPPKILLDFLQDENTRTKWDVMTCGGTVHKIAHIANGRDTRNCVTVLRGMNTDQTDMMLVQETSTTPTASLLIFAPVDGASIEAVLRGAESDYVAVLPSGFAILPDGTGSLAGGGSLITVSFQMLVDSDPTGKLTISSVATVENLIRATTQRIKTLFPSHPA